MKVRAEPYTSEQLARMRQAMADGVPQPEIAAMFPDRPTRAIYTKIRYERAKAYNAAHRDSIYAPIDDDEPFTDAGAIAMDLANRAQDGRFQEALGAAIKAGLECLPTPLTLANEYRRVNYPSALQPLPRGASSALQCVEWA